MPGSGLGAQRDAMLQRYQVDASSQESTELLSNQRRLERLIEEENDEVLAFFLLDA